MKQPGSGQGLGRAIRVALVVSALVVSGVPVVPLVCTARSFPGWRPSTRKARGDARSVSFESTGQFSSRSHDARSPRRRRFAHSSR